MLGNEAFGLDYLPSVIIHREATHNKRWVPLLVGGKDIDSVPTNELFGIAINLWKTTQIVGGVKPVEPIIPQLLAGAQKMASRHGVFRGSKRLQNARRKALQEIGIDFNRSSAPVQEDVVFIPGVEVRAVSRSPAMLATCLHFAGLSPGPEQEFIPRHRDASQVLKQRELHPKQSFGPRKPRSEPQRSV
jgi:hypothetical protein